MNSRKNVFIHPTAEVSPDAIIGEGTKIWHFAHVREGANIGKNCILSKDVYIDKNVTLGDRVKIQNGVSLYQGITLEDDVFVGPHSTFTNDLRPRAFSEHWEVVPTLLKKGSSVGANATILCGVILGEYSLVGAGTVVTSNTLPYGLYVGSPARLKTFVGKSGFEMVCIANESGEYIYQCKKTGEKLSIKFEAI
ncbi:DapH/DapD/GlmU-related protein [Leptospira sp. 'Mane']|uniref:N-acetyltransferase n=1 Tax=Leptospira sp. 'Mane' TaxID=3387407 RepID=UPI00398A60DF